MFAVVFFIGLFFNDLIFGLFAKCGIVKARNEDEVDEKLGTYFECLTSYQRKAWYLEEKHL